MMFRRIFTVVLFALLQFQVSLCFAQENNNNPQKINVQQFRLKNGLTVILNEDHTKAEVFGLIVVKAGSKNDPADATGMAHYQEHMLFKGTTDMGTTDWASEKPYIDSIFMFYDSLSKTSDQAIRKEIQHRINGFSLKSNQYVIPNEFSNLVKSIGGTNLNAQTGPDQTIFYNAFPPGQIEKWLDLYSHRFINPVFRSFQAELEVVYEEKNLYNDMFVYPLLENFLQQFFKHHPYGQQSAIGTIESLKNPSLTKMYRFFKNYYVANNMALVLSGDFNAEEIKPVIEQKFGLLASGDVPVFEKVKEDPFNGREYFEKKLSPIKLAVLGFRTVPNGHPDEVALDFCNSILSNRNETGLLDKLNISHKLLAAAMMPVKFNDYGGTAFLAIPKIVGQSLLKAENLVMAQIDSLRQGKFPDWMIDAIKNQLYMEYETSYESNQYRALMLAESFTQNRDINELLSYPEKIKKITREDILRVANQYYGQNYLAFYSKRGSQKKEKIDKPGYKSIVSNTSAASDYAKYFRELPIKQPPLKFIDFTKDVVSDSFGSMNQLRYTLNPKNDIFTLGIRYGAGEELFPLLKYASSMMNYSGTSKRKVSELKNEFAKIGCTYSIFSTKSYVTVEINGIESNLDKALILMNELINEPVLEKDKITIIKDGEMASRKMERSEPDNIASGLFSWIVYREKSEYIDRLSIKKIKNLTPEILTNEFKKVLPYECMFFYTGTRPVSEVKESIQRNFLISKNPVPSKSPFVPEKMSYTENTIYLVDKKKALQSKIYFFSNGEIYDIIFDPYIEAFNMYFGGDFSGLVLQEVREYRSLAYSAGAEYATPALAHKPGYFYGYIGTQSDKTIEAVQIFDSLYRTMPKKKERMDMIKQYLIQSAITSVPDFRFKAVTIEGWKKLGYDTDPLKTKMPVYQNMVFDDIYNFYQTAVQTKPLVIGIVGDKSRINLTELAKFGRIIDIREKDLFSK
jgi:predicted Zn-dependent peptidase